MNSSNKAGTEAVVRAPRDVVTACPIAPNDSDAAIGTGLVLVREAGVPFQPPLGISDPFVEWLSLMEVVQMLCPVWVVRSRPMTGKQWKL